METSAGSIEQGRFTGGECERENAKRRYEGNQIVPKREECEMSRAGVGNSTYPQSGDMWATRHGGTENTEEERQERGCGTTKVVP